MINQSIIPIIQNYNGREDLILKITDVCIQYNNWKKIIPYLFIIFLLSNIINNNLQIFYNEKFKFMYRSMFRILQFIIIFIMIAVIFFDLNLL